MHNGPVLFFDFDNTITRGDVLDGVIERYSASDEWRAWEAQWQAGAMTTAQCLARQIGDLRAAPEELRGFVAETAIDPAFTEIVQWARECAIDLYIVSDNFTPLIETILHAHGLDEMRILANELDYIDGRLQARFPLRDVGCKRCAHCKAQHLRAVAARPRIFVGDGLSDVCPALVADVVFAKDSLAAELVQREVAFRPYESLDTVLRYLVVHHEVSLTR